MTGWIMEWLSWSQAAWVVISALLCAGSVTLGTVITDKDELELEANSQSEGLWEALGLMEVLALYAVVPTRGNPARRTQVCNKVLGLYLPHPLTSFL